MTHEEMIKVAMSVAIEQFKALSCPEFTSAKEAKRLYGGLVRQWDAAGLLTKVPTATGKSQKYVTQELNSLWSLYLADKR